MSVVDIDREEAGDAAKADPYGYSAAQLDPPDPRDYEYLADWRWGK